MPISPSTPQNNGGSYRRNSERQALYDFGGRQQPADTELEQAVLGALMLEKDAYTTVCDLLKPECFYEPSTARSMRPSSIWVHRSAR